MKQKLIDESHILTRVILGVLFVGIGFFVFFPLAWLILSALAPASELFRTDRGIFPSHLTLENFRTVIGDQNLRRYLLNSLIVSSVTSIAVTLVCTYAGYSFSKFRYPGRKGLLFLIMTAQMFPFAVLLLTIYGMMRSFGLLDTYWALVFSYVTFTLPVGTWTLKSFFDQLPESLIESAKIDGASRMRILHQIILPLTIPGMVTVAIYGFVWSWNDLLYSLTLITSPDKRTLAPGLLLNYMGEFQQNWSNMMAASVWVSVPVTLAFILLQKTFVQGLTAGSVKG